MIQPNVPQAIEVEEIVLGMALSSPEAMVQIANCREDDFFLSRNQDLFRVMKDLYEKGKVVDVVTVAGADPSLATEAVRCSSPRMSLGELYRIPDYMEILRLQRVRRSLITMCQGVMQRMYSDEADVYNEFDRIDHEVISIGSSIVDSTIDRLDDSEDEVRETLMKIQESEHKLLGHRSKFTDLDDVLSGFVPGDMIILASRPAMGKTAFALDLMRNFATQGIPILLFEMEMKAGQLYQRVMFGLARVDSQKGRRGRLTDADWFKVEQSMVKLREVPIYIDDRSRTINEIKTVIKVAKKKYGIKGFILDYLGCLSGGKALGSGARSSEIGLYTKDLKRICVQEDLFGLILHHLNRQCESRPIPMPHNDDMAESDKIERDADTMLMMWRPERYIKTHPAVTMDGVNIGGFIYRDAVSLEGITHIRVTKNRNGPTGDIFLKFNKKFTSFDNYVPVDPDTIPRTDPIPEIEAPLTYAF